MKPIEIIKPDCPEDIVLKKNLNVFNYETAYLCYHSKINEIFELSEKGARQLAKETILFNELDFIKSKINNKVSLNRIKESSWDLITNIGLEPSLDCNLDCSYCCNKYIDKDSEINDYLLIDYYKNTKKTLDEIFNKIQQKVEINFFGGEPFLNPEYIEYVYNYCEKNFSNKVLNYKVNTNLTVVPKKLDRVLKNEKFNVFVSLDGPKYIHDANRKNKNKKGSFDLTINNIQMLRKKGILIDGVLCVLSLKLLENYKEFLSLINSLSIKSIGVALPNFHESKNEIYRNDIAAKRLVNFIIDGSKLNIRVGISNHSLFSFGQNIPCRGGSGESLFISSNGSIKPCQSMQFSIGHCDKGVEFALENTKYEMLKYRVQNNILGCKDCEIEAFCMGGCIVDAISENGNYTGKRSKSFCNFSKNLFKEYMFYFLKNIGKNIK